MPVETEILANMAEATATDVDATRPCGDRGDDENEHESEQNGKRSGIKSPNDKRESAKNFQPQQKNASRIPIPHERIL